MVSLDPPERNREFARSLGLAFPILSDPGGLVASAYGVRSESGGYALRVTFYIDRAGVIRRIDRSIDAANHGAEIARALAELAFPLRTPVPAER